jgi:hypothetical protein
MTRVVHVDELRTIITFLYLEFCTKVQVYEATLRIPMVIAFSL